MQSLATPVLLLAALTLTCGVVAQAADSIWDLEAVNADGTGSDPRVGADPSDPNSWVTIEGIALNASAELLDPDVMWQVYVQAEAPDAGGIAAWQGIWFNPEGWPWPPFPDVQPGDRIRIEGLVSDHNGKVNINSRHSSDPGMQFTVTVLAPNVGMPAPKVIPDVSACNYFDQARPGGGEFYQAQWCQLNDVWIVSGTWGAGQTLTITDDSGEELAMLLSGEGDFDDYPMPPGKFSVRGIFDQEDDTLPYHDAYRLWVKTFAGLRYTLAVSYVNGLWGEVELDPEPDDPNLSAYPGGTPVTLTAVPNPERGFRHWKIYDPNHPGDANHAVIDANNPITIVMDANEEVTAVFKCGGSVVPLLPVPLGVAGALVVGGRKRQHQPSVPSSAVSRRGGPRGR